MVKSSQIGHIKAILWLAYRSDQQLPNKKTQNGRNYRKTKSCRT